MDVYSGGVVAANFHKVVCAQQSGYSVEMHTVKTRFRWNVLRSFFFLFLIFSLFSSAVIPDPQRPHVMSFVKANSLFCTRTVLSLVSLFCTRLYKSLVMIGSCLPVYHLPPPLGYSNSP